MLTCQGSHDEERHRSYGDVRKIESDVRGRDGTANSMWGYIFNDDGNSDGNAVGYLPCHNRAASNACTAYDSGIQLSCVPAKKFIPSILSFSFLATLVALHLTHDRKSVIEPVGRVSN